MEKKVLSLLESKGYKCEKNVRILGSEFDIVGHKKGGILRSDEWIFVECKNKPRVVPSDFKKFLGNFELFCKKEKLERERVQAVFYTTGLFDVMVKKQASEFANIKLKRISLKY
ncbi:MAG: restriction endonuclease [Candidatus Verstraetearchaeota archaeon]|nr:restriction endonuclease [Candidatus Verstraetearchaeota archaeon]